MVILSIVMLVYQRVSQRPKLVCWAAVKDNGQSLWLTSGCCGLPYKTLEKCIWENYCVLQTVENILEHLPCKTNKKHLWGLAMLSGHGYA